MAYQHKTNCTVCKVILAEGGEGRNAHTKSKLWKQIQDVQLGLKPLTDVARAYPDLLYLSLRNHSKKHQSITERKLAKTRAHEVEVEAAREAKKKATHHTERRTQIMDWLENEIQSGNVKPTASAIVALLKQEADIEEKQKDRTHEMQKLFAGYLANPLPATKTWIEGEVIESDDTTRSTE